MVSKCANPDCEKQLHYLREGRVYLFETSSTPATDTTAAESQNEHFWLCGECARHMFLEHTGSAVRVVHRPMRTRQSQPFSNSAMAS